MNTLRLIVREALYRRWGAGLTVLAVAIAVAAAMLVVLVARASENETRIIQRDIGLNVVILPAGTNLDRYWALGYADDTMPDAYLDLLEGQEVANRLIPLLQRRITITRDGASADAMLTGIAAERFIDKKMKPVFGFELDPGVVRVGATVAERLALTAGDTLDVLGSAFKVERILAPQGSADDARVYASLAEVQRLLDLDGRINEIQALECDCDESVADPFARLRDQLSPMLGGAEIIRRESLADARLAQRHMAERQVRIVTPVIIILCGVWIATLMLMNVRERRTEIGVLRSLGYTSTRIASLWIARAIILGVLGALAGYFVGVALTGALAPSLFRITTTIDTDRTLLVWMLIAGPAFAAICSLIPVAVAARTDPAKLLEQT